MPRASLQPEALRVFLFCTSLLSTASLTAIRVSDSNTTTLTCAGNFTLRERSCYSYPGAAVQRSFHHAERHCTRLKASLASLLSPAEESFVIELVENETAFWIGLTDQTPNSDSTTETSYRFKWTDGNTLSSHSHWRAGEPSSAAHLHCVQMDREGWALASGGCASTKLPFVCKKQACPQGLEWSGSDCGIITDVPQPLPSTCLLSHLVTLLLVVCVMAVLAMAMTTCQHHMYRTSASDKRTSITSCIIHHTT